MNTTSLVLALILFVGIAASACVNNCSGQGTCVGNVCNCTIGYGGTDCSIWDREITSGQTLNGKLNTFQWHYYHISLPNGTASLIVNATQTSTFGDIDMYIGNDYYPDTTHYVYKDQTTSREMVTEISPAAAGVWYIGLYGYWSSDYSINVRALVSCPVDCGPNGYCSGSQCVCSTPYVGDDCSIYDLAIQSGTTYSNRVDTGKWKFYHLDVNQGHYLNIVLNQTGTGAYDLDLYVRLNDRPGLRNFSYLNATLEELTTLQLQNLEAGLYEIGVFGYVGGEYTLRATTGAPATCPNGCSAHGTCSQAGSCTCNDNYSGPACNTYDNDLELGVSYEGLVQTGQWNYWHVKYFTQGSLRISISQTSDGDCDTYIRQEQNPSRVFYQIADLSIESDYSLTIQSPGDVTWYIGVFGWTTCSYNIKVELIDGCQCVTGSHGSCSREGSSQCVCEMGWAGSTCSEEAVQLQSGLIWSEQYASFDWEYYYFISDSMAVSITMVETNTEGYLWLFVSMSGYPYGESYDYYDITASSFHEVQIAWYEPRSEQEQRVYFIGVVPSTISTAHEPVEYAITVYGTPF